MDLMDLLGNRSFGEAIAEGVKPRHTAWSKIGYNASVNGVAEIVSPQGGAYVFPTAAQHMHVKSTAAGDTPAGAGIGTITIHYLDSNYVEKSTDVILNGNVASVETSVSDIFRIQNVRAKTPGTGVPTYVASGDISIKDHGETITYGFIATGNTRQRQLVWTVPAGHSLFLHTYTVTTTPTVAAKTCIVTFKATYDDKSQLALTPGLFFMPCAELVLSEGAMTIDCPVPMKLPEKTDLIVTALSAGTHTVAAVTRGWLCDD
jgi:hypothetical protein